MWKLSIREGCAVSASEWSGEDFARRRIAAGVSQSELGVAHKSLICRWERGVYAVTPPTIQRLEQALRRVVAERQRRQTAERYGMVALYGETA